MPNLTLTLLHQGVPISAKLPPVSFSSTLLGGGAVVTGPIQATPWQPTGYIRIDTVRVELAAPGSTSITRP